MKSIYILLLFIISLSCTSQTSELSMHKSQKQTFQFGNNKIIIDHNASNPFSHIRSIENYINDKPAGIWINQSLICTSLTYFENGKAHKIEYYDFWGNKVSDCIIKDGKPADGTIWSIYWGLNGLKNSCIIKYKNSKVISEHPYKEEQISLLLEKLSEILKNEKDIKQP